MRIAPPTKQSRPDRRAGWKHPGLLLLGVGVFAAGCPVYVSIGTWEEVASGSTGSGSSTSSTSGTTSTGGPGVCAPGATQACYDGPTGTEGVGTCMAGTQTCDANGGSWGPCMGEVLPQPPNCASGKDLHCDGTAPVCSGSVLWAKRFGDASDQLATGVAVDPSGDVLVAGAFRGSVDFGNGSPLVGVATAGSESAFVAKLRGSDGGYTWANGYVASMTGESLAVRVLADSVGDVLVLGEYTGSVDLGGGTLTSGSLGNAFVLKLDRKAGSYVWAKDLGGGGAGVNGTAMALDPTGELVVGGQYSGVVDFGGGPLTAIGGEDVFVAKYAADATATHLWSRHFGFPGTPTDGGPPILDGIAVNTAGEVFATGTFKGTLDFGGTSTPLMAAGLEDAFVVKLEASSGTTVWAKHFGGPGLSLGGNAVAVDAAGNVLVTGFFDGSVNFGCGALTATAMSTADDAFLVALDPSGGCLWSTHLGAGSPSNFCSSVGLTADIQGDLLISGTFMGSVAFGGPPIQAVGTDAFLGKLDPSGHHLWSYGYGDPSNAMARSDAFAVATDASNNVLVAGDFSSSIDFGGGPLNSMGGADIFVAKLSP